MSLLTELVSEARILAAIAEVKGLPASAPVVVQALACLEDPDSSMRALKKLLMSDQAVAARILRLANSAYFGFRSEVQTLSQAVVLLGQNRLRNLLHRILVDRLLNELGHAEATEVRCLSLATATASCMLSQLLARDDAEEMLLAGLLHNIGELFFLTRFSAQYQAARAGEPGILGLSWGRIGRLLLEAWRLPCLYQAAAEFCLEPLACQVRYQAPVWQVHAARKLAEGYLRQAGPDVVLETIAPQIREECQLDGDLVGEIFATLLQRMSLEQLQAAR